MIYATILPDEIVWDGFDAIENKQYTELTNGHRMLIIDPISSNQARIVRLISPDPLDYLNPSLSPGTIISYGPAWLE